MCPPEEESEGRPRVADSLADAEREIKQLQQAVESRTVIGQAEGILMERFNIPPDQAFAVLRRVSQEHNVKLNRIADDLKQMIDASRRDFYTFNTGIGTFGLQFGFADSELIARTDASQLTDPCYRAASLDGTCLRVQSATSAGLGDTPNFTEANFPPP